MGFLKRKGSSLQLVGVRKVFMYIQLPTHTYTYSAYVTCVANETKINLTTKCFDYGKF